MNKFFGHLKTILKHRRLVRKFCFKCGLYRQGLAHDLSKFSPTEFITGVKYFTGKCSPNEPERSEKGYSAAWLHHKGRNRHHWEYWFDIKKGEGYKPIEMPLNYAAEMCCDRIAACRVYHGKDYKQGDALEYYLKGGIAAKSMHPNTAKKLTEWLESVRDKGEEETFRQIKKEVKAKKQTFPKILDNSIK